MSGDRVRYGIKYVEGLHMRPDGKRAWWTYSYVEACERVETSFDDSEEPRIVKLRRKKRPRVVAKHVETGTWGMHDGATHFPEASSKWIRAHYGRQLRITIEVLADE